MSSCYLKNKVENPRRKYILLLFRFHIRGLNDHNPSSSVWIGLTDSTKSGKMTAWKDLDGNPIGNRYVNLRVIDLLAYEIQFNVSINH